jgi:hypothetical protein
LAEAGVYLPGHRSPARVMLFGRPIAATAREAAEQKREVR